MFEIFKRFDNFMRGKYNTIESFKDKTFTQKYCDSSIINNYYKFEQKEKINDELTKILPNKIFNKNCKNCWCQSKNMKLFKEFDELNDNKKLKYCFDGNTVDEEKAKKYKDYLRKKTNLKSIIDLKSKLNELVNDQIELSDSIEKSKEVIDENEQLSKNLDLKIEKDKLENNIKNLESENKDKLVNLLGSLEGYYLILNQLIMKEIETKKMNVLKSRNEKLKIKRNELSEVMVDVSNLKLNLEEKALIEVKMNEKVNQDKKVYESLLKDRFNIMNNYISNSNILDNCVDENNKLKKCNNYNVLYVVIFSFFIIYVITIFNKLKNE